MRSENHSKDVAPPEQGTRSLWDVKEFTNIKFSWYTLWLYMGPGWLMSIAFLDPGNIEGDLQQGIAAGYKLNWVLLWSTALGWLLQILAARIGVVTGKQLARVCREEYPSYMRVVLWLAMEFAIIGSDVQVLLGSSIAISLLSNGSIPLWGGVLITGVDSFFLMLLDRIGVKKFEAIFAGLLFTMLAAFMSVWIIGGPHVGEIALGLVIPEVPAHTITQAVGTLGAVIMPHNLYLHSALVRSRKVDRASKSAVDEANYYNAVESGIALLMSLFINLFVVSVFAHNFYDPHQDRLCPTDDNPNFMCKDVGLLEAGSVLAKGLGSGVGKYVWSIGLLASGQSSVLTSTYAGQFVMSGFWNIDVPKWKRALITRAIALLPGIVVALTAASQFDAIDQDLNLLQSVALPFALLPLLKVAGSPAIMGPYANSMAMHVTGWVVAVLSVGINVYTLIAFVQELGEERWWAYFLLALCAAGYAAILVFLVRFNVGGHAGDYSGNESASDGDDDDMAENAVDVRALSTTEAPPLLSSLMGSANYSGSSEQLSQPLSPHNQELEVASKAHFPGATEKESLMGGTTPVGTGGRRDRLWWRDPALYIVPEGATDSDPAQEGSGDFA